MVSGSDGREDAAHSDTPRETLLQQAEQVAKQAGVSLTRIRRHVYELLLDADEPLGAYEVARSLEGVGSAKPATAYRALYFLEGLGLIRRIRSLSKFVALKSIAVAGPQAFVVCEECGTTEQIELGEESRALFAIVESAGFRNLDAAIELSGRCQDHSSSSDKS